MQEGLDALATADYRTARDAFDEVLAADPLRMDAYRHAAWIRGIHFGDYRGAEALLDQADAVMREHPELAERVRADLDLLRSKIREQREREDREDPDR
jgi:Tfp pilus assembly protein PilF